jgi:Lrp/AsnC family transcriptional regulator
MSTNQSPLLDSFDLKILSYLQQNGAATAAEVGTAVGLSQSPCWRRIQRLTEAGFLQQRVALLSRKLLGLDVLVFAFVKLEAHGGNKVEEFRNAIRKIPEVQECHVLMGQVDFLLKVVTQDIPSYERLFFEEFSKLPGVREINSMISVSSVKETTALPLDHLRHGS